MAQGDAFLAYRRSKFSTRLPTDRLFTPSHFWLSAASDDQLRVGFTKFATRMLGEVVEFEFEVPKGSTIELGQTIGWIEGFKAVSDLYAPLAGRFVGPNPELERHIERVHAAPYDEGWLYTVAGTPPEDCLDAPGYAALLDGTIDRMLGQT